MFITFEGIEGSGKSSHANRLASRLESMGYDVVVTREPGGTKIGKHIREILLSPESSEMEAACELLLYLADRVQHQNELIIPSLEAGKVVICDRYFDASIAYQAEARGLGDFGERLIRRFGKPVPDITILLDCPEKTGLARAKGRVLQNNEQAQARFEAEDINFHRKVRKGYLELARRYPERIKVVSTKGSEASVEKRIWKIVSEYIKGR